MFFMYIAPCVLIMCGRPELCGRYEQKLIEYRVFEAIIVPTIFSTWSKSPEHNSTRVLEIKSKTAQAKIEFAYKQN